MAVKQRFEFIDQFRGLIGVMMALGHANYYFNSAWLVLDPLDPTFDNWGQFALRYMGYLCAPGFLLMNGAMMYWLTVRAKKAGLSDLQAAWRIIQRGLFLILVQLVWVNASWSGFARFRMDHYGIIATIGTSMILLTLIVRWHWAARLAVGATVFLAHPFLLRIPYDHHSWTHIPMQFFVDSGDFNKYPVLPWFGIAVMGSVMAHFWFERWRDDPVGRAWKTILIGSLTLLAAWAVRLPNGFGNLFAHSGFFDWSFFLVQKYPPSLAHQLWFTGTVIMLVGVFAALGLVTGLLRPLGIVGRVPMFFYAVHIPLLAIFTRRIPLFPYREGAVFESLVGWVGLLAVMIPLAIWFGRVKQRNKSWIIRMI